MCSLVVRREVEILVLDEFMFPTLHMWTSGSPLFRTLTSMSVGERWDRVVFTDWKG